MRLHPNLAAIVFDDFLADGQADAVARVFATRVQALEDDKNVLRILGSNSDSVIVDAKAAIARRFSPLARKSRALFSRGT